MRTFRIKVWVVSVVAAGLLITGGTFALKALSSSADSKPAATASAGPTWLIESSPSPSPTPPPGADLTGPLDLLILGVDTRVNVPDWQPHSDAIMLLHVEADLQSAYLYSLPRDLRVSMPKFAKAGFDGGTFKLTEAMSYGSRVPGATTANVPQGYELLTSTLTAYTGIKQFQAGAILNFGGLAQLVDRLGGIDLTVDEVVKSHHHEPDGTLRQLKPGGGDYIGPQKIYQPGKRHLVGWEAIDFARQRYGLPNGDYDRQRHQRQLIEAVLTKARGQGLGTDTTKLMTLISTLGQALVYVGGQTPLAYGYALRNLSPARITMVSLPGDSVMSHGEYLGEQLTATGKAFLAAIAKDQPAAFIATHPELINK